MPGNVGDVVTDAMDAAYKVALRESGQDCRSRFEWLRNWFKALPD